MKPDFDVRQFSTGLDALKTAHLDNLARAEREKTLLLAGITSEQEVHRYIEDYSCALDRTNMLKAMIVDKLIAHRAPQIRYSVPVDQRHGLTHALNKLRADGVIA
jgi:hypothetical protein